jgi:hypothetical protein
MPVQVQGVRELNKALRMYEPDLKKNLNKEIRSFLTPVVKTAKGYVPNEIPGLSNWTYKSVGKKINKNNSSFRRGKFPKFNPSEVKAGIRASLSPTRVNSTGFITNYAIVNATAAGAILETAGRKNPAGQPWNKKSGSNKYSHSNNPDAGLHFINSMARMKGEGNMRGRVIYKAWAENEGRAYRNVINAVERTSVQFAKRSYARTAFKVAA